MSIPVVLGGDIGGTSCKIVISTIEGDVLSWAKKPGGNIRSNTSAYDNIFDAIDEALAGCETDIDIKAAHLGIAGAGLARWAEINNEIQQLWSQNAPMQVTSDLETAFAAMSPTGNGLLVLSGTGAVSVVLENYQIRSRCDGMGWLLGDIGSGTWFGTEVLKAVAAHLDQRGPQTALVEPVMELLGSLGELPVLDDPRQVLIAGVYGLQPAQYGLFAPLVFEYDSDEVALSIITRGLLGLRQSARSALEQAGCTSGDLVLAGALVGEDGPLAEPIASLVTQDFPGLQRASSQSLPPVVGALKLALKEAGYQVDSQLPQSVLENTPFR